MERERSLDQFREKVNVGDLVRFEVLGTDPTTGSNFTTEYTGYAWGSPQVAFPDLNRFHHTLQGVDYVMGNVPPKKVPGKFPVSLIPIDFRNIRFGGLDILSYEIIEEHIE